MKFDFFIKFKHLLLLEGVFEKKKNFSGQGRIFENVIEGRENGDGGGLPVLRPTTARGHIGPASGRPAGLHGPSRPSPYKRGAGRVAETLISRVRPN